MKIITGKLFPIFMALMVVSFFGSAVIPDMVHAKSKMGGKMFKSSPKKAPSKQYNPAQNQKGSFAKGMAGGLLGGALGGLLFGSLLGGQGMGILPLLLLIGVGFFLFRKMGQTGNQNQRPPNPPPFGQTQQQPQPDYPADFANQQGGNSGSISVSEGLAQIGETDPGFDEKYFQEIASDVFFQVQAGWMRRDLDSYRHLLGDTLAAEYAKHFEDMEAKGIINKLESIAVRGINIVEAGSDGKEDFITVQFTASLLDYTVDENSGEIVEGSDSVPVKFNERWTWARPVRTDNWKLEGIHADE